jgi:hypothetical protein
LSYSISKEPFEGTATDLFVGAFNEAARPTQIKLAVSPRVRAAVDDRQNPDMLQNTVTFLLYVVI